MQVLTAANPDELDALLAADEFFWLDLEAPEPHVIRGLARQLGWHPLVVEDLIESHQRPKMDRYGDYMLLVFYGARHDADTLAVPVEVHLVISGAYVVTIHGGCSELADRRQRLAAAPARSEQYIVYTVLDTLTDTFFPVLETIDGEIDRLQEEIALQPSDAQLQELFHVRRELVGMRRIVTPQRDLAARALSDIAELPGLDTDARDYFRDVYDHLIRISDLIDAYRDLLSGSMDVYLSTVSNRLNVVMKQLTIVATIFLPISALTGFFGQNFGWLVNHLHSGATFFIFGVGGVLLSCLALFTWFRRSGFLD